MQTIFRKGTVFILVSLLGTLEAGFSFPQLPQQEFIADSWYHKESGSILEIDLKGEFEIKGRDETVIETGSISVECWESTSTFPGSYYPAIVLRFSSGKSEWLISGYFIVGEGDPSGLYLLAATFPKTFSKAFRLDRANPVLQLWNSGP